MITELTTKEIVRYCRTSMGIPKESDELDNATLSGLLRHCAGILCPCSRAALRSALIESLVFLGTNGESLVDQLDDLVDDLIVTGDLLELSEVAVDDSNVKGTWVFAAPQSFVVRPSGNIFLTGIVPDQNNCLPTALETRIVYSGCTRFLVPEEGEDLVGLLNKHGVNQLSDTTWLKSPKGKPPEELLSGYMQRLTTQQTCGTVNDLEILDTSSKVTYYRSRWTIPTTQSGNFVARRPQEFGAPIWCFVELVDGTLHRLLDLPLAGYHWRGCDAAWHLQLAIDKTNDHPQRYRRQNTDDGVRFYFFSPLPIWGQRRLMTLGRKVQREKSLFAYEIPIAEARGEDRWLQENFWLAPDNNFEDGRLD